MSLRVGVDIGGTFTDFCVFDEDSGALHTLKVLSTPERPGEEVLTGIREIERRHGVTADDISYFTHGTTVGVNTVIQRKGINLCLFTTEHFEDVLEVARLKMPDPYDLFSRRPVPLVTREKVFPIPGRMLFDGSEDMPLDEDAVKAAIAGVRAVGGEGIVVSLLHSYRNPAHERRVVEIVRAEAPDLFVVSSFEVWPIIREYERTVTAVVAGYVQPRVSHYLGSLQAALREAGVGAEAMITKSNGGVMTAEAGKNQCAQMLLSGTASGVIGACQVARMADVENALSLDIGGTSADVAVVRAGEPQYGVGEMIGEFPIHIPTVSVTSIGEGGGSIAWIDPHGVLKVGPESAGSTPGPACYGNGGDRPTITDAFVVCGFLGEMGPEMKLGYGEVTMRKDLAEAAIANLAEPLSMSIQDTAEAIIKIAVSGMYLEVSKMVSRYGIDPREMSLVAFGGAGPMLACHVARELNMRRIVVPMTPGVLSAFGGLIADIKNDFIQTVYLDLDESTAGIIKDGFADLRQAALSWLREEQGFEGEATLLFSADMRYRGQSYEIDTLVEADGDTAAMAAAFHAEHERLYEHADREAPVQVINLRLVVVGEPPKPALARLEEADGDVVAIGKVQVHTGGQRHRADIYRRGDLAAGHRFRGPAIVSQDDCTTCVLDGFTVTVDGHGNLIIEAED